MIERLRLRTHEFGRCGALVLVAAVSLSSGLQAQEKSGTPAVSSTAASESPALADTAPTRPRVFVAKLQAGSGASEGEASLLNDALLVAIKRYDAQYEIRTSQDLEDIVNLELAQTMTGCDVVSCAAELGDALGAEQLVTGQLGRVGKTWILSLTRTDRATLKSIARTQTRAQGDAPDVLFPLIDKQAAEVFATGDQPAVDTEAGGPSMPLLIGGGVVLAAGTAFALGAGAAYLVALQQYGVAADTDEPAVFDDAVALSKAAYLISVIVGIGAGGLLLLGASGVGTAFVLGGE